jgi:hypothetical protein
MPFLWLTVPDEPDRSLRLAMTEPTSGSRQAAARAGRRCSLTPGTRIDTVPQEDDTLALAPETLAACGDALSLDTADNARKIAELRSRALAVP